MIAVVPAAGKGTRMAPITQGRSKEMLPVGGAPLLDRILAEAFESGADRCVIIVAEDKPDLLAAIDARQDGRILAVPQRRRLGLGHAVAVAARDAENWFARQPMLVLLPDSLFFPCTPTPAIAERLSEGWDIVLAVQPVAPERRKRYGIVETDGADDDRILRVLEKPNDGETESCLAVTARYGFSAEFRRFLEEDAVDREHFDDEAMPEMSLSPTMTRAIASGLKGVVVRLDNEVQRLDCGSPEGYAEACALWEQTV